MKNNDIFVVFASQILANLYECFPISTHLPKGEMTAVVAAQSEFWKAQRQLTTVEEMEELLRSVDLLTPELATRAQEKKERLQAEVTSQSEKMKTTEAIYAGTVSFLSAEGYILEVSSGKYQITAKGLAHLNKPFEKAGSPPTRTAYQALRDALRPETFTGSIASGTFVSIITKVIGT